MIGPAIGVLLATYFAHLVGAVRVRVHARSAAASHSGSLIHPCALRSDGPVSDAAPGPPACGAGCTVPVLAVLVMAGATRWCSPRTDVGIVAALRDMGHQSSIGWVLAIWGLGSAVGGLVYGALHRAGPGVPAARAAVRADRPGGLRDRPVSLAVLLFFAGLFCAPTITATVDHCPASSRSGCAARRWAGTARALTAGSAIGAPIAGVAIDRGGWQGGFLVTAAWSGWS